MPPMQIKREVVKAPSGGKATRLSPPDGKTTHPDVTHTRIENVGLHPVEIVDAVGKGVGEGKSLAPGAVLEYAQGDVELFGACAGGQETEVVVTAGKGPFAPQPGATGATGAAGSAASAVTATTEAGAAYTLALADAGTVVELTSAEAQELKVPSNAEVAFPVGTIVKLSRIGAGAVTVVANGGVTVHSDTGKVKIAAQFDDVTLRKRAANEWILTGSLA